MRNVSQHKHGRREVAVSSLHLICGKCSFQNKVGFTSVNFFVFERMATTVPGCVTVAYRWRRAMTEEFDEDVVFEVCS